MWVLDRDFVVPVVPHAQLSSNGFLRNEPATSQLGSCSVRPKHPETRKTPCSGRSRVTCGIANAFPSQTLCSRVGNVGNHCAVPNVRTSSDTPFRVLTLAEATAPDILLVRDEYLEFLADVEKARGQAPNLKAVPWNRQVVTLRSGLRADALHWAGKSFGACYFLFHLLASGKPVFIIKDATDITYFGPDGCEVPKDTVRISTAARDAEFAKAVAACWVLIDIDPEEPFALPVWTQQAGVVVWTSSPNAKRMRNFMQHSKHHDARIRYCHFFSEREKYLARLQKEGPVARSVFDRESNDAAANDLLEEAVRTAINKDSYLSWAVGYDVQPDDALVHRVFLVLPLEIVDEATGEVTLDRERCHVTFLSNHVAHLAAIMIQKSREVYAARLAAAFDAAGLRSGVGPLFENILHDMLHNVEIDSETIEDVFGVPAVSAAVMLAGDATNFVVEAGKDKETSARPLYLRPFLTTFAAIDSISSQTARST
ncbi:hypothetical protein B0H12DRAFT_1221862 [Mycena haematopus]|nr:hypothetical protein B0H12DRAFT_1221862 [Mycena haematopus]